MSHEIQKSKLPGELSELYFENRSHVLPQQLQDIRQRAWCLQNKSRETDDHFSLHVLQFGYEPTKSNSTMQLLSKVYRKKFDMEGI